MRSYAVIIIGAGASGMIAGVVAARKGVKVLIIDRQEKCGHKLYATGNGRCNFTNEIMKPEYFIPDLLNDQERLLRMDFVKKCLDNFNKDDTIEFFKEIGMLSYHKDGYYYPAGEQAYSLVHALERELNRLNVTIKLQTAVDYVEKKKVGLRESFIVHTDEESFMCSKLLLACGGEAGPIYGCKGDGYRFAKDMGHDIKTPLPSLTALYTDTSKKIRNIWAGVRFKGEVRYADKSSYGEMILTDYGISGIPIFQLSGMIIRELNKVNKSVNAPISSELIFVDFIPDYDEEELFDYFKGLIKNYGSLSVIELIRGVVNFKISEALLNGIYDEEKHINDLTDDDLKRIIDLFKNYEFKIIGYSSYEKAQVTSGGVNLTDVDFSTMMSKKVEGLYFSGEILDVSGLCGGYNLQWAWTTGYIAGTSLSV